MNTIKVAMKDGQITVDLKGDWTRHDLDVVFVKIRKELAIHIANKLIKERQDD